VNWRWSFWVKRNLSDNYCPRALWDHPAHKLEILTRDLRVVSGRPEGFGWQVKGHAGDIVAWRIREDHPSYDGLMPYSANLMYDGEVPDERDAKVEPSASMTQAAVQRHPLFGAWS